MKLIEMLDTVESNLHTKDRDLAFRLFDRIGLRYDLWISVQASYAHYCNPRKTLTDLSQYTTMEFALMDNNFNFTTVSDVFPDFSKLNEIEKYLESPGGVYCYVPVELIETLINEFENSQEKHSLI